MINPHITNSIQSDADLPIEAVRLASAASQANGIYFGSRIAKIGQAALSGNLPAKANVSSLPDRGPHLSAQSVKEECFGEHTALARSLGMEIATSRGKRTPYPRMAESESRRSDDDRRLGPGADYAVARMIMLTTLLMSSKWRRRRSRRRGPAGGGQAILRPGPCARA